MKKNSTITILPTYVFIDVSNIRSACLKSCGFNIDFMKLLECLNDKYPNLIDVKYYEGMARGDTKKKAYFNKLEEAGYSVKTLLRRTYTNPAIMKSFKCRHCGSRNRVKVLPSETRMKSNVDVFLASEMLEIAYEAKEPIHIVILACDGDYAEAIKIAAKNKNVRISVIATPSMRDWRKNALSVRLKELRKELSGQYQLNSIADIKDYIMLDNIES